MWRIHLLKNSLMENFIFCAVCMNNLLIHQSFFKHSEYKNILYSSACLYCYYLVWHIRNSNLIEIDRTWQKLITLRKLLILMTRVFNDIPNRVFNVSALFFYFSPKLKFSTISLISGLQLANFTVYTKLSERFALKYTEQILFIKKWNWKKICIFYGKVNYNDHCTKSEVFHWRFFCKCKQIFSALQILPHLPRKSLTKNFIFCPMDIGILFSGKRLQKQKKKNIKNYFFVKMNVFVFLLSKQTNKTNHLRIYHFKQQNINFYIFSQTIRKGFYYIQVQMFICTVHTMF